MNTIIFDCERMKYENTGLFSYCFQLSTGLLKAENSDPNKFAFFIPKKLEGIFGKEQRYIPQNSLQKFCLPSVKGFDVWHSSYQNSMYIPFLNRKIKVVLTIHDINFLYDETKPAFKKEKYLRHLQRNIDRSDSIVCISEYGKNDVLKYCDVRNKPVTVIHNGTNTLEAPSLVNNSYRPKTRFLFSIGVMSRLKNFHSLLPLLQNDNDMELLIAGKHEDADYFSYLKNIAKELGVEGKLRILGAITEPEKSWYYQNCYAFAFPSLSEGFGLPVAEAMSVGKPLFLSNRTALPEIGKDVAFYFKDFSAQQMQHDFASGMELYQKNNMTSDIKKRGNDFCWDKAAQQYLDVYRSLS